MTFSIRFLLFFICFFCLNLGHISAQNRFIKAKNGQFYISNKVYTYIGANYWYGGFVAADTIYRGKDRIRRELDFLVSKGVKNIRIMMSSEGDNSYPYRIYPSIQERPGHYNEEILRGFDYFVNEAGKRDIKLVMVLNNNWEWSGGFGQYLEWSGHKNPILPKTSNWDWDRYCEYISQFYTCDSCLKWNRDWIKKIITRRNTISQKLYSDDPSIMSWELANEPRPMTQSSMVPYQKWIRSTANYIKTLDKNHLVTIGVEGIISTRMDSQVFLNIHQNKSIDYVTIHIWPKTWQWYNGQSDHSTSDTTLAKTKSYIQSHAKWSRQIHKPMVIEEFGMHRDENSFRPYSPTSHRDKYFEFIYQTGIGSKVAGYNFWGCMARRSPLMHSDFWTQGLPYGADPPQEEQGLYGIYSSDSSTWNMISKYSKKINSFK